MNNRAGENKLLFQDITIYILYFIICVLVLCITVLYASHTGRIYCFLYKFCVYYV